LERRVQERTAELEAANKALESFSYSIAHDLRAPLRAISGFSQVIMEDYAPQLGETGSDYARRIVDAAARMDALIRDLLAYGRLEHVEIKFEPVQLESVLKTVLVLMRPEIDAAGAQISWQSTLPVVWGSETLLEQIFTNLLSNAIKFVSRDVAPQVEISAQDMGPMVHVSIKDNGIGIALANQHRIFEVFQRLNPPQDYPGTGVGLAIVERAIARIGGRVGVQSEPGKGSAFWIDLRKSAIA
jgi:signal transduction histidine kinase